MYISRCIYSERTMEMNLRKHEYLVLFFVFSLFFRECHLIAQEDLLYNKALHHECVLPMSAGPCRAGILQYYFYPPTRKCYSFYYGGCQGNGNRFKSYGSCMRRCSLVKDTAKQLCGKKPHFCKLSFEYGYCFGASARYSYNFLRSTCEKRLYSGCGGNQNNFRTFDECIRMCAGGAKVGFVPRNECEYVDIPDESD